MIEATTLILTFIGGFCFGFTILVAIGLLMGKKFNDANKSGITSDSE